MTDKADADRFSWHDVEKESEKAEIARLAAVFGKRRKLPKDIVDLMWEIATLTFLRMVEPDAAPFQFGRFEALDTKISEMGMVIEARDPQLDRKVAIMLLFTGPKTLAQLSHLNGFTIYETGKWHDRVYFVMEWVDRLGRGAE